MMSREKGRGEQDDGTVDGMRAINRPMISSESGSDEFNLIANSAPVPIWVTGLDRRRRFVNRAYVDFLGRPYQDAVDFDWREIIHPDDVARIVQESVAGEASLQTFSLEGRYRRADGEWRWLHSVSQPRRDGEGRHIGFIGVAHDVTDAKLAEQELREREEQLSAFISQTTAGFGQVDLDGRFTLVNDRFCEIAGRGREELLQLKMQEITHPDDIAHNVPLFERAVRDGTSYSHEKRYIRPDGSIVWVNNSVAVIRKANGEPYGVLAVTLDVTARREAEAALRESEARFRTIFEEANDFLITSDLDQTITSCNPAVLAALGYDLHEVLGRSFSEFLDPDQFAQANQMLALKMRDGGTTRHTITVRHRQGHEMVWEISSRLTYDEQGRPVGLHAIGRDVTEAKRAQQHQQLLIDELNHRVKNTLAIVQGIAQQTLKDGLTAGDVRNAFNGRLAALATAHNLLTREQWIPVALDNVIRDAVAPHGSGDAFEVAGPHVLIPPKTAISMALAMHELATNAVKHGALSQPEGRVSIRWHVHASADGDRLVLDWSETGGPPVALPGRRGFGTRMIERGLSSELGGTVSIDFAPRGIRCHLDAPLPGHDQ